MTPRRLAALQEGILDAVKRAHPGTTDAAIAAAAGVDRTQVSKWRAGEREMRLGELVGMMAPFGAVAVLGPVAALDGADLVERAAAPPACPRATAMDVTCAAADLGKLVHHALADGRIDGLEAEGIANLVESMVLDLRRLSAGARGGPVIHDLLGQLLIAAVVLLLLSDLDDKH